MPLDSMQHEVLLEKLFDQKCPSNFNLEQINLILLVLNGTEKC